MISTIHKLTGKVMPSGFQKKHLSCLLLLTMLSQTASIAKTPESSKHQTAADKLSLLSGKYTGDDLFGLTKKDLLKRFPAPDFKHTTDFSQVTWHGTDTSSVLDLRFKDSKVVEVRLSTHYGYPRPGTTSDVEVGQWMKSKQLKSK